MHQTVALKELLETPPLPEFQDQLRLISELGPHARVESLFDFRAKAIRFSTSPAQNL